MTKRKYQVGKKIESLADFEEQYYNKGSFYFYNRYTHRHWMTNWKTGYLMGQIRNGKVYAAELIDKS